MANRKGCHRYQNGAARRKLRARLLVEEEYCGICGGWIDKTLPAGHPYAPEVDEKLAFSRGGSAIERSNVRLVHRICNQRRGDGTREERAAVPIPEVTETARDWGGAGAPPP